ncbi:MAG: hypothetical protein ACKPKO_21675 [Candidatus Fonsibacter sp.]
MTVPIWFGLIKIALAARSERVSKYNRLLRIEEEIGKKSEMVKLI